MLHLRKVDLEPSGIVARLIAQDIRMITVPPLNDWEEDAIIKDIQIEDWLRRDPIHVDIRKISAHVEGQRIMITGAAGSIGREMVRQIAGLNPYKLILVDQAESPLHNVQLELLDNWRDIDAKMLVADVTNQTRMESIFKDYRPQYVFHAAAYKHVPMMEDNVSEAIQVNILGTKTVADLSVKYKIKKCMIISTDHAFCPVHAMGYSKCLAEMYVQGLSRKVVQENSLTKLFVVRFSDVYPDAPRSLMTVSEACQLILETGNLGENGEIYVFEDDAVEDTLPTSYEKIRKSKGYFVDYTMICEQINTLTENNCMQDSAVIINKMKKIISYFSESCADA